MKFRINLLSALVATIGLNACQTTQVGQPSSMNDVAKAEVGDGQLTIKSKNTTTELDLLADIGKEVPVKVVLANSKEVATAGLAIIIPSSTPDMEDEEYYASIMRKLGLATAVVYGAGPRYMGKFSSAYTSSIIVRDVVATISAMQERIERPKNIFVLGSSLGSHAIFKMAWSDYRLKYPELNQLTAGFMINAACPDSFLGKWDNGFPIYAMNGVDDDSTPASACKTLQSSGTVPGFKVITYPGAHHFESPNYGPTDYEEGGKHIIPTCSINYSADLYPVLKLRAGSAVWDAKEKGFGKAMYKWMGKTCLRRGNFQGYVKKSSDLMWENIKKIISSGGS